MLAEVFDPIRGPDVGSYRPEGLPVIAVNNAVDLGPGLMVGKTALSALESEHGQSRIGLTLTECAP